MSAPAPVPDCGPAEVAARAEAGRQAASFWRRLPVEERASRLRRVWKSLLERRGEILRVVHRDTGKPLAEVETMEVSAASLVVDYFTSRAGAILGERPAWKPWFLANKRAYVRWLPRGLVGIVTPWSLPFLIPAADSFPALLAGNAVLLKPSEWASRTALWLEGAVRATGLLPDGLLGVATGGPAVGSRVTEACDMVVFTGSPSGGRSVAEAAARGLKPAVLELGGKHPMIVLSGAALSRAARAAVWGAFANAGALCVGVERAFVEEGVHDEFVAAVRAEMSRLRVGAGGTGVDMGRLIHPGQRERLREHLDDARALGAQVIGGEPLGEDGLLVSPALVLGAKPEMKVMREETFGPVLPVMRVDCAEQAVALSNAGPLGLCASLWTADEERAERLGAALETGLLGVNDLATHYAIASLPFGGVKSSGLGWRHSDEGLRMFCRPQSVCVHEFPAGAPDPWWFPYETRWTRLVSLLARLPWI